MNKEHKEFAYKTFEYLFLCMMSAGGDGDSALLCDNWKEAANLFEVWSKEHHPDFLKRTDNEFCIWFSGNQEGVGFFPYDSEIPKFAEVVIKTLLL